MSEVKLDTLFPVSINLLCSGMTIPHDVHDDEANLLILRGNTLDDAQIEAIRRLNKGKDTIYVTAETHKMLLEHTLSCEIPKIAKIEEETGYTEVKDETLNLLMEIEHSNNVSKDKLHNVSEGLSHKLEVTRPDLLVSMINTLAPEDEYLQRHSINVGLLNGLLGRWLGLPKKVVDQLIMIGLLHDCGKKLVPQKVLNAPRKLTKVEFEVIKMHAVHSYTLLKEFSEEVRLAARGHHEKINGRGYPDNLSADGIPIAARITAVSDIYDAMVSRRVYKGPNNPFRILGQLRGMRETELDARLVDVFTQNMPKELIEKPVILSNGEVGVIDSVDENDVEHPYIRVRNKVIKSNEKINCVTMYIEE
ncbi:MAG: HD domain-containing protein [Oscillospiraceae bacterium]|nr:HD domain-containing protein [Oscillospiraceae bacterium]